MSRDEKDFLVDKIKQSGIPLEIFISNVLSKNEIFYVEPKTVFLDYDTNLERELDLKASLNSNDFLEEKNTKQMSNSFEIIFLIECKKKPTNSWIFFKNKPPFISNSLNFLSFTQILGYPRFALSRIFDLNGSKLSNLSECYHYIEIKQEKNKDKQRKVDNIFEATSQLKKALYYEIEMWKKDKKQFIKDDNFESIFEKDKKDFWESIEVFVPIIVFDGKLFEVDQKNPYEIKRDDLKEVSIVRLMVETPSKSPIKIPKPIFVIKKEYFKTFLEEFYELIKIIGEKFEKNSKKIKKEVEEAYWKRK